ncbi:MAG: hypothetical protein M1818_006526 [Claussenomyces sp. TS43310]|nr:MAG: hypothetical protein M1818_006526 [Claussenomyces sp. TS43310]
MDPSTTLFTFMFQALQSTQSVSLVGSWDNFSRRYLMERDSRRGRGQWRGCYTFSDIICDDAGDGSTSPKRSGGLKMGHTYWYYYELDDGTEIYDPTFPFTSSCPYLPGQPVNSLWVPIEVNPLRERSASMGSIAGGFKTMNPEDKFLTPRAPPAIPRLARLDTSPTILDGKCDARSVSPREGRFPRSARALFGLRAPASAGTDEQPSAEDPLDLSSPESCVGTSPSGAMSPTSLWKMSRITSPHRQPIMPMHSQNSMPSNPLTIPFDITEEELSKPPSEDDEIFGSSYSDPDPDKRLSLSPLSPRISPFAELRSAISEMKPLPMLPNDDVRHGSLGTESTGHSALRSPSRIPPPLRLPPPPPNMVVPTSIGSLSPSLPEQKFAPGSHFSLDTLSSGFMSPTDSHYSMTSSWYDSQYDEDGTIEDGHALLSGDPDRTRDGAGQHGFVGYSLPDGDFNSQLTLRKDALEDGGHRLDALPNRTTTFGSHMHDELEPVGSGASAVNHFLDDMGYLGGVIVGK